MPSLEQEKQNNWRLLQSFIFFCLPPLPHFDFFPLFLPFLYPVILRWTLAAAAQLSSAQFSGAQGQNEPATAASSPPIPMTNVCMQQDLA